MKIVKVISGGQSGADLAGLVAAYMCGIKTGGTAPFGYKTEYGPNLELRDTFKLLESKSELYIPRTYSNVHNSDMTFWFGSTETPGFQTTLKAVRIYKKEWHEIDFNRESILELVDYMHCTFMNKDIILNVAGNRESKNPGISDTTYAFMVKFLSALQK